MKTPRLVAAACAAALCAVPVIAEDLTIVYKTTGQGGVSTATSYYSSERMRVADAQSETIVEYGPGRIVSIDHKKKEYSEVTLAELEAATKAMSAKMEQANAQMKEQMANMPPAVRAEKMEQMMGGAVASVTVKKGATRQVAGYDCQACSLSLAVIVIWHDSSTALWLGTLGLGASIGTIFPNTLSFAGQHMTITGRVTSLFFVGTSLGGMFFPWFIGQLIEPLGALSVMWTLGIISLFALGVYAWMIASARRIDAGR